MSPHALTGRVARSVVHHFDVEKAVVVADAGHDLGGDRGHARLDGTGKRRWIFEALDRHRAGIHHRIDDADDARAPAARVTFDRDLRTLEQALDDRARTEIEAGIILQ